MFRYNDIIKDVPDYKKFMGVDELNTSSKKLAKEYPEKVKLLEVGKGETGELIYALKIGTGKKKGLTYGSAHANEPVGGLTTDFFANKLVEDREFEKMLGYTWYIIKCIDPMGLRRNEGWATKSWATKEDLDRFIMNYFRRPPAKDVEYTYPIQYKTINKDNPLPETKIIMDLHREHKFDLIVPLQDMGVGGVLFTLSDRAPALYSIYQKLAKRFDHGFHAVGGAAPSSCYIKLATGVAIHWTMKILYEYFSDRKKSIETEGTLPEVGGYHPQPKDDPATTPVIAMWNGTNIFEWGKTINPNLFVGMCEACRGLWYDADPKYYSGENSDMSLRDASLRILDVREDAYKVVEEVYDKAKTYLTGDRKSWFENFLKNTSQELKKAREMANKDPFLKRSATVGDIMMMPPEERANSIYIFARARIMLDEELKKKTDPGLETVRKEVLSTFFEWNDSMIKDGFALTPPKKLVSLQLSALLATADYVRENL